MLQVIEVDECSLELFEMQVAHLAAAGDFAHQTRDFAATERARLIKEAAVGDISSAVTNDDAASSVQWRDDDLTRFTFASRFARFGINDLHQREIRMNVVSRA